MGWQEERGEVTSPRQPMTPPSQGEGLAAACTEGCSGSREASGAFRASTARSCSSSIAAPDPPMAVSFVLSVVFLAQQRSSSLSER